MMRNYEGFLSEAGPGPRRGGRYPSRLDQRAEPHLCWVPPEPARARQAARAPVDFDLPYYATGDVLRAAVGRKIGELSREAKSFMDRGDLVPDEVICRVVVERVDERRRVGRLHPRPFPPRHQPGRGAGGPDGPGPPAHGHAVHQGAGRGGHPPALGSADVRGSGTPTTSSSTRRRTELCGPDKSPAYASADDDEPEAGAPWPQGLPRADRAPGGALRGRGPAAPLRRHPDSRRGERARRHPRQHCVSKKELSSVAIIRESTRRSTRSPPRGGSSPAAPAVRQSTSPGVTTAELDEAARPHPLPRHGAGVQGLQRLPGSYHRPTRMVVHSIQASTRFERGDVLCVDIGVQLDQVVADAAVTLPIGPVQPHRQGPPGQHPRRAVRRRRSMPGGGASREHLPLPPFSGGWRPMATR